MLMRTLLLVSIVGSVIVVLLDWHFVSYYLLFELSSLILIPVLSSSSRSYRKSYAMFIMYLVILLGTMSYALLLSHVVSTEPTIMTAASNCLYIGLLLAVIMLKSPSSLM